MPPPPVFQDMVDIHCHILPGIDDGAKDWDTSVEMARMAVRDGIRVIVATPHMQEGVYMPEREAIRSLIADLQSRIADLPLRVLEGADVHYAFDLTARVKAGQIPLVNGKRYLLLELPTQIVPVTLRDTLFQLRLAGAIPILTHPERHAGIQGREDMLLDLIAAGACVQVSGMSLAGQFGRAAARSADRMLRMNLVHCLASDAHSTRGRTPELAQAASLAARIVGESAARAMVCDVPARIIEGAEVDLPTARPARRWFTFWRR